MEKDAYLLSIHCPFPFQTEPMERLMNEYAKERHTSVDKLAFYFDGDKILPTDTPDDLDLEDSFCVDVTGI